MSGATLLALILGGSLAALLLLWSMRDPLRTIVPIYAFLVPLGGVFALRVPLPAPFNTLSSAAGALAIVALLGHLVRSKEGLIPTLPVGAWLLFVAWGAVSFLWAMDQTDVVREISLAVPLLAIVVLVGMERATTADLRLIAWATIVPGALIGGIGAFLIVAGGSFPEHGLSARFSLGATPADTNPNQLAASLLLPSLLAVGITLDRPHRDGARWQVVAAGATAILTLIAIVLSGSRGGVLATAIGAAIVVALAWRWQPWRRDRVRRVVLTTLTGIAIVVGIGVAATALAPDGRVAAIIGNDALQRLGEVESSSGRAEIWTTGVLACQSHCFAGAGLGTFTGVYNDVIAFSDVTRNVGLSRPGHNLYLEIAVETGLVGVLLFASAIALEFRSIIRRRSAWLAPALAAAVVAVLVADIFEGFLWFKHAWLPFTLLRVFERAADDERAADHAREMALLRARP